jgi:hypothetical protein
MNALKKYLRIVLLDGPAEIPQGMLWCPNCRQFYTPRYATQEEAVQTQDKEGREQWISGICSTRCLNESVRSAEDAVEIERTLS